VDLVKLHPNERVDLGDVEFLATSPLNDFQRHMRDLVVGDGVMRILDGFTWSTLGNVLTVVKGKAALTENRDAQLLGGHLTSEGVASLTSDFTGLPADAYGIWVRFAYADGSIANRVFWDPLVDLSTVQAVDTRKIAGWQLARTLDAQSPGGEWYKVATVNWSAGFTSIVDHRAFLFEGPADSSPQTFRPSWGGGTDRNTDRATYGVKTLERFASAVLKKIEELQSSTAATRWWEAPPESLDRKVSRFGDLTLAGNYKITGDLEVTSDITVATIAVGTAGLYDDVLISPVGISLVGSQLIFDAAARISGNPLPLSTGQDLGATGNRWDAFLQTVNVANGVTITAGGLDVTGATIFQNGAQSSDDFLTNLIRPVGADDDLHDIGTTTLRYRDVFATGFIASHTDNTTGFNPTNALARLRNFTTTTNAAALFTLEVGGAAGDNLSDGWGIAASRGAGDVSNLAFGAITNGVISTIGVLMGATSISPTLAGNGLVACGVTAARWSDVQSLAGTIDTLNVDSLTVDTGVQGNLPFASAGGDGPSGANLINARNVPKCWVSATFDNSATEVTLNAGFNLDGTTPVEVNGLVLRVNFGTNMANTNYAVSAMLVGHPILVPDTGIYIRTTTRNVAYVEIGFYRADDGVQIDASDLAQVIMVQVFGVQT
jgi:hypothetical protein